MPQPPKLVYGEGTVYWDETNGRWLGEFNGSDGKRRRVSGGTKTEATKKLKARRSELDAGITEGDTLLGSWIDWWLENVNPAKSPNNAAHYKWALSQLSEGIKKKRLRDLKVVDVEAELKRLATRSESKKRTRGTSPRSLNQTSLAKIRRSLGVVLTEGERRDMLSRNVAKLAHIPAGAKGPVPRRSLSAEEASALLSAAQDDGPWYALIAVMLYCGLRPGEVTGLPWTAIDLKEGTLTVLQSRKVLPGGTMKIGATKTHSDRVMALPAIVEKALREHRQRQVAAKRTAPAWEEHGLVFANEIGRPLDPSNLRRVVDRLCGLAEVDPISPNELRHTAATLLVDSGMRLEDVADFLGHKDTSMLIETYRHRAKRVVNLTEGQGRMLGGG
jgi:integrase